MREVYPKLITTLFIILLAALVLKYTDVQSKSTDSVSKTASISADAHKRM